MKTSEYTAEAEAFERGVSGVPRPAAATENHDMTDEEFNRILDELCAQHGTDWLLSVPGVYEVVAEELNNAVLSVWSEEAEEE